METSPQTVACYENMIPDFVPGKLEQLYGSMYASFAHFQVYGGLDNASTYVSGSETEIKDIFLYRRTHRRVQVINEQMQLDDESINSFARTMFERYPDVNSVCFHAVDIAKSRMDFPYQHHVCTNDITMPLPATVDEYYAKLGKSSRKTLNQNGNRLQRRYQTFQFTVLDSNQVSESQLREVIALNHARMAGKSRVSAINEKEAASIIAFTKQCGLTGLITIDGKIRAGAICFRIGDHFHLRVIGHDPEYNTYGLGMLCCYRTICECITRGGTMFHFMWGQEEYKYRLLGEQRQLTHIVIYRSHGKMLVNCAGVLRTQLQGWRLQSHMWLQERLRHKDHATVRLLYQGVAILRSCKQTAARLIRGKRPVATPIAGKREAVPTKATVKSCRGQL